MTTLAFIAIVFLVGFIVLGRELRRAPLLPPGYDADGQPLGGPGVEATLQSEESRQQPQEARN